MSGGWRTWPRRALHWLLVEEGSTRGLGLMRIGITLMVWVRLQGFYVVHSDSTPQQLLLSLAFHLGSLMLLLGAWTRLANVVVAGLLVYGYHYQLPVLKHSYWMSNNINLLVTTTAILALTPSGLSWSVDRWLALRRAERRGRPGPDQQAPLWSYRLLGLLVASVYLSTATNKTEWAWLSGERLAAIFGEHYWGSAMLYGDLPTTLFMVSAVMVWLLEGLLAFGLFIPRLRAALVLAGIFLHGSFCTMFRVYAFSTNMILLYLPFFPTQQVDGVLDRLLPAGGDGQVRRVDPGPRRRAARLTAVAVLLALLTAGAVVDLRSPTAAPRVQLLEDRFDTFLLSYRADRRTRYQRDSADMQRWKR